MKPSEAKEKKYCDYFTLVVDTWFCKDDEQCKKWSIKRPADKSTGVLRNHLMSKHINWYTEVMDDRNSKKRKAEQMKDADLKQKENTMNYFHPKRGGIAVLPLTLTFQKRTTTKKSCPATKSAINHTLTMNSRNGIEVER